MIEILNTIGVIYIIGMFCMLILAMVHDDIKYVLLAPVWPILYAKYVWKEIP